MGVVIGILFLQEVGQAVFEMVFLVMVGVLSICSFLNFYFTDVNYGDFFKGFIPSIPEQKVFVEVLGSIIMPQNIFLHSSLVQTRSYLNL